MLRMTASDASWLRMDRAENTADIVGLLWFDGPLDFACVRRVVEERLLRIERFRQRVVPTELGLPRWEPDPDLAAGRHVRRVRVQPGGLRDFVSDVASSDLDPAHPPWQLFVVEEEGAPGALVAKLHHVLGDGFALMAVLRALVDDDGAAAPAPHRVREAAHRPSGAAAAAARALRFGGTVARLAALPDDPPDTSAVRLSGIRRVAWSSPLPHAELRRAARRQGATTNDLLVAAVSGGLRAVLAAGAKTVERRRRAIVPVNLRTAAADPTIDGALGNQFGLVFVDLPVDLATAGERLAHVRGGMRGLRAGMEAMAVRGALEICGCLPTPLHRAVATFFARKASLVVTNVPGPTAPVRLAGKQVTGATFWVPHPANLGLGVSILGYAGELRVGVRADVAVLADPEELVSRIEEQVAELVADAPEPDLEPAAPARADPHEDRRAGAPASAGTAGPPVMGTPGIEPGTLRV